MRRLGVSRSAVSRGLTERCGRGGQFLPEGFNFPFQLLQTLQDAADGVSCRVGEIGHLKVDRLGDPLAIPKGDLSGHANHHRVWRDLLDHHRAGADSAIIPHLERAEYLGPGADHDIVPDRRMPLLFLKARTAQRDALIDGDVLADLRGLADNQRSDRKSVV